MGTHTQSKQYTPVGLGEILQKRSFQASGEVNPLQKDTAKSKALTLENDVLVQEEDKIWQPRSVLSVMDGINSVRWAFILLQIGEEEQVHEYADWSSGRQEPVLKSWSSFVSSGMGLDGRLLWLCGLVAPSVRPRDHVGCRHAERVPEQGGRHQGQHQQKAASLMRKMKGLRPGPRVARKVVANHLNVLVKSRPPGHPTSAAGLVGTSHGATGSPISGKTNPHALGTARGRARGTSGSRDSSPHL